MARAKAGSAADNHRVVVKASYDYLLWAGAWRLKILGGVGQRPGVPDILSCIAGRLVVVEVKTGSGKITGPQQAEREALEGAGALYILAHGVQDVEDALLREGLLSRPLLAAQTEGSRRARRL